MKIKIVSSLVLAILMIALLAIPASAGYRVGPDIVDTSVRTGDSNLSTISIGNESDKPEDFKVILAGYGQGPDGSTLVLDQDTNPLSASSYIKFAPAEFHMEPGAKQKLDLTVSIPAGTTGGRYAVLLVITNPRTEGGVSTITRLGVPIRLTVADSVLIKKGQARIMAPSGIEPAKPISITVNFANEGNIHYRVKADTTITDARGAVAGQVVRRIRIITSRLFPGLNCQMGPRP